MSKGGGPRVLSRIKMRICRMSVSIYLAGVSCFGRLRQRTLLSASCLEIAGSDEIRSGAPMFLSGRLVSKGVLRSSTGCYDHTTRFLVLW
jgi:hypothetical protein